MYKSLFLEFCYRSLEYLNFFDVECVESIYAIYADVRVCEFSNLYSIIVIVFVVHNFSQNNPTHIDYIH